MTPEQLAQLNTIASDTTGLSLFVLYGSRARGDATAISDWDFGYLGNCDAAMLNAQLVLVLHTDAIDLVNLQTASAVLRARVANDAIVVHQVNNAHADFWFKAVSFWLDMGPLIQAEQARLVAETAK